MSDKELRTLNIDCEMRAEDGDDGKVKISGYAAVFNIRSNPLGGFVEIIMPGAFDDVLNDDTRCLFNHNPNYVLGRNKSTLKLSIDSRGLFYEVPDAPQNQTIRDLVIDPMRRGDINQSSFAFSVARGGDKWYEDEDGAIVREIHKVARLYDVSPVTYPAYEAATSTARSLDEFKQSRNNNNESEQRGLQDALWRSSVARYLETI